MSLRNQPYIPLYVQDVLTDEKLVECSASSHGVYLLLICILHKQEQYGLICLKQKYKQIESKYLAFATMLEKQMPFQAKIIQEALIELHEENVISIDENVLFQKRMVKDGELSILRTENGKKGGSTVTKQYGKKGYLYFMSDGFTKHKIGISTNPLNRLYRLRSDLKLPKHFEIHEQISVSDMGKAEDFALDFFKKIKDGEWLIGEYDNIFKDFVLLKAKIEAKIEANTVIENEYENEDEIENKIDIENEVFDLKIQNSKKSEIESEIKILVDVYQSVTGRKFKAIQTIEKNYQHWRKTYLPSEIEQAIVNIPKDKFWSDKMTPVILFRQRNPNGENVDYIGGLLEYSKSSNEKQKANAMSATAQYLESLN